MNDQMNIFILFSFSNVNINLKDLSFQEFDMKEYQLSIELFEQ